MRNNRIKVSARIILLSFLVLGGTLVTKAQSCYFIGQVSLDAVGGGAFLVCSRSGVPAACTIALAATTCQASPACDGVVKHFVEQGCEYTVERVNDVIKITGKLLNDKWSELQKTWEALNAVNHLYWLNQVGVGQ